ncbi:zincin [Laetiporus sulphureus 93-53]|uniref:Zincin n=1 Tax=Laetiporus sulphureus 93-53 TaxID=1314785 RepID=A0A165BVP0_9APHY|nr:zincin [Laetiporus sulphureus 93-53]KZT01737.1 zincin [Laetiporus sulphureus 93-53]
MPPTSKETLVKNVSDSQPIYSERPGKSTESSPSSTRSKRRARMDPARHCELSNKHLKTVQSKRRYNTPQAFSVHEQKQGQVQETLVRGDQAINNLNKAPVPARPPIIEAASLFAPLDLEEAEVEEAAAASVVVALPLTLPLGAAGSRACSCGRSGCSGIGGTFWLDRELLTLGIDLQGFTSIKRQRTWRSQDGEVLVRRGIAGPSLRKAPAFPSRGYLEHDRPDMSARPRIPFLLTSIASSPKQGTLLAIVWSRERLSAAISYISHAARCRFLDRLHLYWLTTNTVMASLTPPQSPPSWTHSAEQFLELTKDVIAKDRRRLLLIVTFHARPATGEKERVVLLKLKEEEHAANTYPSDGNFYTWDYWYYHRVLLERSLKLDDEMVKERCPVSAVVPTILEIYQNLLGVWFVEINGETWHPDVQQFAVWEKMRMTSPALSGIVTWTSSLVSYSLAAMVANLAKPTPTILALMPHNDVVTFFHDIGHVFHELLSRTRFSTFHGTSMGGDFVEAPSQMLQNWCILTRLFVWQPTDYTALWNDLRAATTRISSGLRSAGQAHSTTSQAVTMLDTMSTCFHRYLNMYTYSLVFAADMYTTVFKQDPLDPVRGARYRKSILLPGGGREELDSLKELLGHAPNSGAFLKELFSQTTTTASNLCFKRGFSIGTEKQSQSERSGERGFRSHEVPATEQGSLALRSHQCCEYGVAVLNLELESYTLHVPQNVASSIIMACGPADKTFQPEQKQPCKAAPSSQRSNAQSSHEEKFCVARARAMAPERERGNANRLHQCTISYRGGSLGADIAITLYRSSSSEERDIVIVGGGPEGPALSSALASDERHEILWVIKVDVSWKIAPGNIYFSPIFLYD